MLDEVPPERSVVTSGPEGRLQLHVGVIGPGDGATDSERAIARLVGEQVARDGATVVCGGLGGVMDAAAEGAARAGGTVLGILPDADSRRASPHLTHAVCTGMREARDLVLVNTAHVVIAIGWNAGTAMELVYANRSGKEVFAIGLSDVRLGRAVDEGTLTRLELPVDELAAQGDELHRFVAAALVRGRRGQALLAGPARP